MVTRRVAIASLLFLISLVLSLVVWSRRWNVGMVSGDVQVSDSGFWTYPRYTIAFPTVEASHDVTKNFTVAGLPPYPMTFELAYISGDISTCRISVRILDHDGNVIYEASGPASEWRWQIGAGTSLWDESLRDMRFRVRERYTVEITIDVGSGDSAIALAPRLSGGGNELP